MPIDGLVEVWLQHRRCSASHLAHDLAHCIKPSALDQLRVRASYLIDVVALVLDHLVTVVKHTQMTIGGPFVAVYGAAWRHLLLDDRLEHRRTLIDTSGSYDLRSGKRCTPHQCDFGTPPSLSSNCSCKHRTFTIVA